MLTKTNLMNFIKRRNESSFATNLQFHTDAQECGFDVKELGKTTKRENGYSWSTPYGTLIEENFQLRLDPKMTNPKDELAALINDRFDGDAEEAIDFCQKMLRLMADDLDAWRKFATQNASNMRSCANACDYALRMLR